MHVFPRKSPLCRSHFFEWLKTVISSNACGTSTLKSPLLRAFFTPHVHQRLRKCPPRCTLDCGFKTPESPALRGFVAERGPIRGTSLYLVLLSNGLRHLKNLPVKFSFSPINTPATIAQKLPPQRCSKPFLIPIFNFSHKRPTFAFTSESGYTLAFRRRIAHNGSHGETGAFPSANTARRCAASEIATKRKAGEKRMHVCGVRPLFSGVAAPLGCAVLIVSQFTLYISAYRLCATLYLSVGYWRGLHDNRKATLYQKQQGVSLSMVMWCPL